MQALTYTNFKGDDDQTKSDITQKINDTFKTQISNAFVHSYMINDEMTVQLQKLFEHRFVLQQSGGVLQESSHPILAILNEYSNVDANNAIINATKKGLKIMTIGDAVSGKLKSHHNCLLLNSSRDCYRVGSSNATADYRNFASGRTNTSFNCIKGSQNCYVKANLCYAVHSLYDITVEDVAKIFYNHDLDRMVVYMYFPLFLYDKRLIGNDLPGFNCLFVDKDRVAFAMKDFSAPYIHNYELWKTWATLSKISTNHFDINIEHVRNYGPLHVLNFVRCRKHRDVIPIYIPITKYLGDFYFVPNIYHGHVNDFAYHQAKTQHFLVPAHFVEGILSYASRVKDESYRFAEVAATASGYRTQIIIGNHVYRDRWDVHQNVYKHVVLSLFILGAIDRSIRTKTISSAFRELKDISSFCGLGRSFSLFCKWLDRTFTSKKKEYDENEMSMLLDNWQVVKVQDMITTNRIHVDLDYSLPIAIREDPELPDISAEIESECSDDEIFYMSPVNGAEIDNITAMINPTVQITSPSNIKFMVCDYLNLPILGDKLYVNAANDHLTDGKGQALAFSKLFPGYKKKCSISTPLKNHTSFHLFNQIHLNVVVCLSRASDNTLSDQQLYDRTYDILDNMAQYCVSNNLTPYLPMIGTALFQNPLYVFKSALLDVIKKHDDFDVIIVDIVPTLQNDFNNCDENLFVRTTSPINVIPTQVVNIVNNTVAPLATVANATPVNVATTKTPVVYSPAPVNNVVFTNNAVNTNVLAPSNLVNIAPINTTATITNVVNKPNATIRAIVDVIPRSFITGHCAIRAVWYCFPANSRPTQKNFLTVSRNLLLQHAEADSFIFTVKDVDDYILKGNWQCDCSATIIGMLATHYQFNINIIDDNLATIVSHKFGGSDKVHLIKFSSSHYTNVQHDQGGKISKFDAIISKIMPYIQDDRNILDMSAAPGYFINKLFNRCEEEGLFPVFHAGVYTGKNASKFDQPKIGINFETYSDSYANIFKNKKFDFICNDAGREVNSEALTMTGIRYCTSHLNAGGSVMIKTFADPHVAYEFATHFRNYEFVDGQGTERYLIATGYHVGADLKTTSIPFRTFEDVYSKYHRDMTEHSFSTQPSLLRSFNDSFFQKPFDKYKQIVTGINPLISVSCYTGYASSSKTTNLIKQFPKAIFVAPTKDLSLRHQRSGVKSFTQHAIFGQNLPDDSVIVVDELSQFCVEYLILLKNKFNTCKIILSGDVDQTEYANYNNKIQYTTFKSQGVCNNIIDVYKIPQDIAISLNKKFNWHIRTHSNVAKSVYKVVNIPFDKLKKFGDKLTKVICYNNETAKKLVSQGFDASTITTYTGSRTENVILYIDGAAIESNYINKDTVTYTAMTRATHRLFLYGDTDSIVRYYNFDATLISTYEEYSKVYFHDEMFVNNEVVLPLTQETQIANDDTVDLEMVEEIIDAVVKPTNPDYCNFRLITNCELPEVESGTLTTNTDALTNIPKEDECFNVSKTVCNVINQLSDNSFQTIKTLVKRYSKKYVNNNKKDCEFTYTALVNGICTALYGNAHSVSRLKRDLRVDSKELLANAFAYMESLNEKLGENYATTAELLEIFDTDRDGQLTFFNKRQTKWKAADGFDTTDKVGQGIAAFDKKVNILFSAYSRTLLDKIKQILVNNGRRILLATHDSEAGINDQFLSLISGTDNTNYTCNDFSEWDASFRKPFAKLTNTLCKYMGMDDMMNKWFTANRDNWKMIYRNSHGMTKLKGSEKQFSGNPFTICENTIGNMALCFTIFKYSNFQFGLFKGDDSAVACGSCTMLPEARKILSYTKHGLKLHNSPIGEFAGWFLTREGIFPDVLRYASKFISKNYRDKDHYEEALTSLQERCAPVKNEAQLHSGCAITAKYYTEQTGNHITPEQINILFHFLKNSRRIKFNDLHTINKSLCIVQKL